MDVNLGDKHNEFGSDVKRKAQRIWRCGGGDGSASEADEISSEITVSMASYESLNIC